MPADRGKVRPDPGTVCPLSRGGFSSRTGCTVQECRKFPEEIAGVGNPSFTRKRRPGIGTGFGRLTSQRQQDGSGRDADFIVDRRSKLTAPATSEQSPLCSGFFFAFGEKEAIRPLPCSSFSAKGHARLACSVVNALATAHSRYHPFAGVCDRN